MKIRRSRHQLIMRLIFIYAQSYFNRRTRLPPTVHCSFDDFIPTVRSFEDITLREEDEEMVCCYINAKKVGDGANRQSP